MKFVRIVIIICGILMLLSYCEILNYDKALAKLIDKLPNKVNFFCSEYFMPEKLWLHRVDSIEKQKEFCDKYKGLEFDIIYYESYDGFENSHDIGDYNRYDFEKTLLTYQKLNRSNGIWLDFKNLSENNKIKSCNKLNELIVKYKIDKSLIWVESNDWESLKYFKDNGFKTSYYFPYYDLKKMSDIDIKKVKMLTEDIALSGAINAISFDGDYYNFIKTMNIPNNVVFLSWFDSSSWSEVWLRSKYQDILNDEKVKVILVKDLGNYHR